jgi:hypothetical protein
MHVEDMDLNTYPVKAHSSPDGEAYVGGPKPATNTWRIDYVDSNGYAKWIFYKGELSSAVAEIPTSEIRILEQRMEKPSRITGVKFGLISKQEEPGGPWVRFKPNDKDPRAELYYEGKFTDLYFDVWRKKAYDGHFDAFKLIRAYSKDKAAQVELNEKQKYISQLEEKLAAGELEKQNLIIKNNALMQAHKPKK